MSRQFTRREFLKTSVIGSAALFIGFNSQNVLAVANSDTVMNPFVRIDGDGTVTVIIKHFEMGQGSTTGLATLVAEELDADWQKVKTAFAPSDASKYNNLYWGPAMGTGGSTAIANSFIQYRQAGASARELLVRAASKAWSVDVDKIQVSNGVVSAGSKRAHFGQLISEAMALSPVKEPQLKSPEQFNLIGKHHIPRKDSPAKTNGTAIFAMDVKRPGMIYAAIMRTPKFGGLLTEFDDTGAKQVNGFISAKALPDKKGVVVFAKHTWAAFKARDAIKAQWDFVNAESRSSPQMATELQTLLANDAQFSAGNSSAADAQAAIRSSATIVEAEFSFPFLAHAPMEPVNCVIEPTKDGVRVIDGCQGPTSVQFAVAEVLGMDANKVEVKTVYAGGSFGRRITPDSAYQVEAAQAFALYGGKTPVKLVWSREDDIHGGYYRPMSAHRVKVGLDSKGNIQGWDHRLALKPITKGTAWEGMMVKNGVDATSVEGVADTLYGLPKMSVGLSDFQSAIPVLWWRSVGHTHTAYVMESLMDMIAHQSKQDPIKLRLSLLDQSKKEQARMANVIKTARDLAKWKPGDKRGFASHISFNTYVAVIADVSVDKSKVKVNKLYIAVDCGVPVNPDVIRAQMEGGSGFALGAIARNEITFKDGMVEQNNFPDYLPIRFTDMPKVEVAIVPSSDAPSGVGEPGVPPTGPAIANAVFAVTGKRITTLPMSKSGFTLV